MADDERIGEIINSETASLGFDLVRVAWVTGEGDEPSLQVMAERPDTRQLTIDDCAKLSRALSARFDALEEAGDDPFDHAYRLEVSSPGIDRPLTRLSDFSDWASHEAKIELAETQDGRKRFRGTIDAVEGSDVLLTDRNNANYRIAFDDIESAKLVLTDRLIAATAPLDSDGADEIEEAEDN